MEITAIIFLSLVCLWLILDLMKTSNRRKYYRIGYTKATLKYGRPNNHRTVSIGVEADQEYHDEYEDKHSKKWEPAADEFFKKQKWYRMDGSVIDCHICHKEIIFETSQPEQLEIVKQICENCLQKTEIHQLVEKLKKVDQYFIDKTYHSNYELRLYIQESIDYVKNPNKI